MAIKGRRTGLAVFTTLMTVFVVGCGKSRTDPEPPPSGTPAGSKPLALRVHSGGTMYATVAELAGSYEKETGQRFELKKGGSGPLFRSAVKDHDCDVYVCHTPFLVEAQKAGVIDTYYVVAGLRTIIAVPKGNPKGVKGVKDLAREGLRVGITHEKLSTAGWVAPICFRRAGIAEAMSAKDILRTEGSGDMVRAIVGKKVDAGIVWNAVAWANRDKVDIVDVSAEFSPDPKVDAITTATHGKLDLSQARVSVIVFDFARDRNAARAFASYVNSERSRKAFEARGFLPPRPEDSSPSPSTRQ